MGWAENPGRRVLLLHGQLSNLGVAMSKLVLRITTAGLLATAGFIGALGANITVPAIAHGQVAVSTPSSHSVHAAPLGDDQWG